MDIELIDTVLLKVADETFKTGDIVKVKYGSGYLDLRNESFDPASSAKVIEGRLITPSSTLGNESDKIDIDVSKEFNWKLENIYVKNIISIEKVNKNN